MSCIHTGYGSAGSLTWRLSVRSVVILACAFTFLLLAVERAASEPSSSTLISKAINYRAQLTYGKVVYLVKTPRCAAMPSLENYNRRIDIAYDGDDIRAYVEKISGSNILPHRSLVKADVFVYDFSERFPAVIEAKPSTPSANHCFLFNPSVFGIYCCPMVTLHKKGSIDSLRHLTNASLEVSEDNVEGVQAWRVDIRHEESEWFVSLWIAEEYDFGVIKVAQRVVNAPHKPSFEMHSIYGRFNGYWYPKISEYKLRKNGKILTHEITEVLAASFDRPLDSDISLAALKIPAGRGFIDTRSGDAPLTWNGSALIRDDGEWIKEDLQASGNPL